MADVDQMPIEALDGSVLVHANAGQLLVHEAEIVLVAGGDYHRIDLVFLPLATRWILDHYGSFAKFSHFGTDLANIGWQVFKPSIAPNDQNNVRSEWADFDANVDTGKAAAHHRDPLTTVAIRLAVIVAVDEVALKSVQGFDRRPVGMRISANAEEDKVELSRK